MLNGYIAKLHAQVKNGCMYNVYYTVLIQTFPIKEAREGQEVWHRMKFLLVSHCNILISREGRYRGKPAVTFAWCLNNVI